jgi:hypothetical protein
MHDDAWRAKARVYNRYVLHARLLPDPTKDTRGVPYINEREIDDLTTIYCKIQRIFPIYQFMKVISGARSVATEEKDMQILQYI